MLKINSTGTIFSRINQYKIIFPKGQSSDIPSLKKQFQYHEAFTTPNKIYKTFRRKVTVS